LLGEGTVSIAPLRLGLQNEVGVLVAGSKRADFPTEIEMLLLRVAANQAGIGLQEARLSIEQRLAAEWLERRVVERTRRHAAVNEELRKEIIERKRADAELRESERRYRYIFQSTGVSIWEEDFSQVKIAIDDLKAKGVHDFRQYLATHPEFVQQAISMVKIIDVNAATVKLFEAQSKDELLVSLHKIFLPEAEEVFAGELIAIAEGRTNFESETVLQTLKGDKLAVLFTITFPRQPAKLNSVLVSIMDITERKQTEEELRKTQVELAHVTRVMTMGELAASIAHEVNQPLAAIVTNGNACLRWLAGESPNLDEARETARHIVRDGNRAGDVIGRIRTLLRKTGTEKELLDMNQVIREVVALAEDEVRRNGVALRTELAGDLPLILGDRVELQQVVLNLIMNAIEAMSAIGDRPRDLVIRTQRGEVDQVRVTVQDSGIGLDPQCMGRIFDAFYTTKSQGMGMGLAISRSIIAAHGGRLWAVPNDGPGMTFEFALPVETASAI
jgi:C4-dicarboxylate-specific signal transduction histidine kinase